MGLAPHQRAQAMALDATEADRLRSRLAERSVPDGDCLIWTGCIAASGYGRISVGNRTLYTHRAAMLAATGELPAGVLVLHSCDRPPCVNAEHLRVGSPGENMEDKVERGRLVLPGAFIQGEGNGQARLTWPLVQEMRERYARGELTKTSAGREYGISRQSATDVLLSRTWTAPGAVSGAGGA